VKLALGTVQFGLYYGVANRRGRPTGDQAQAILNCAARAGINMLDTATAYGESEARLGQIGVAGWQVVSKLSAVPDDCSEVSGWVENACAESLRRLGLTDMYGLLLHRPQQLLEKNGDQLYQALQHLKQSGLVQKIGMSIYGPEELDALAARFAFDLIQVPFNILDRRMIESGWLKRLAAQGTEIHVRSVFLQGLLLMSTAERPAKFERWSPLWTAYESWLSQTGLTPLQACLRHALSFDEISSVVIGVDSVPQLEAILEAATETEKLLVPPEIQTNDIDLLNPAHWIAL
jgi:aryl-alcohol dehydrogenase-like predicted oxidoreductase